MKLTDSNQLLTMLPAVVILSFLASVSCQDQFGGGRPFSFDGFGGGQGRPFGGQGRPFGGQGRPFGGQGRRPFGGQGRPFGMRPRPWGRPGGETDSDAASTGADDRPVLRPPFRPPFAKPGGERGLLGKCPMVGGLKDPRAFLRICLESASDAAARCPEGCGDGEACCPTNIPDGVCQWKCQLTVDPQPKAGQCPAKDVVGEAIDDSVPLSEAMASEAGGPTFLDVLDFSDDSDLPGRRGPFGGGRGPRWIRGFCHFAIRNDKASPIGCRHDGDCSGSQKCCSPGPNPENFVQMCERKCITVS